MPSRAVALLCLVALGPPARAEGTAPAKIDVSGAIPRSASLGHLAVLTDAEPSRSLRQLRKLEVVDVVAR